MGNTGRLFFRLALFGSLFMGLHTPQALNAHPAHAEPVKYPFVVGFERFHTNLDTPEHLAGGGLVLLNELNCVACHAPPEALKDVLTGRIGTRLAGVGDRFDHLDLEMMIRSPRFVKTDTIMPSMFSGPDRDLDEIVALKHFLFSLREPIPKFGVGDLENGKQLYHKIGCVTCHAPEVDYRPPWIPANIELSLTSLPSVPLNLSDRYPRDAIIDLLLNPYKHRPSGRMPRFDLTTQEAIDIGTYLNSAPKPELPEPLKLVFDQTDAFVLDPEKVREGRILFGKKNCVACHSGISSEAPQASRPLDQLTWAEPAGCLAERPKGGGAPAYGLDELQKKAIKEALKRIGELRPDTIEKKVDWTLLIRNCYACHERGGKGGPEFAREVFFTTKIPDALANGRWGSHPPNLNGIGAKLTDQWWKKVLFHEGGSGSVRDFMALRMPVYRPGDLGDLIGYFQALDQVPDMKLPLGDAARGYALVGFDEKNCVACHGLGDLAAPGIPSINLTQSTDRLKPEFFSRIVRKPSSINFEIPMPNLDISEDEVADLWAYLGGINQFSLPDGLLLPDVTELKPLKKPIVIRCLVKDVSTDAVAVGFPNERNVVFDVKTCRWVAQWKGRFLDPGLDWKDDGGAPLAPLGEVSTLDGIWAPEKPTYKGFQLDSNGVPVFIFQARNDLFRDQVFETGDRLITGEKTGTKSEKWME